MSDDINRIANDLGNEYATLKHEACFDDPKFDREISETSIDFARGFVAGYLHHNDEFRKQFPEAGATKKVGEAQKFVDQYILKHKKPPTYAIVANELGISRTAAFSRLRFYRCKMNSKEDDV